MKEIPDGSIDMVMADLPYGTTAAKWDEAISFSAVWEEINRSCKESAAMCFFGSEPFSSRLRMSNLKWFKYDWIWLKDRPTGFLNAKKIPLGCHEVVSVFYRKPPIYNPQFWQSKPMNTVYFGGSQENGKSTEVYGSQRRIKKDKINQTERFPLSYLKMNTVNGQSREKTGHPTQKPVELIEYLIKTYTNKGDTVLDPTMGSGSTGVAAFRTGRKFIGIELDQKYFEIAEKRINEASDVAK